jgi:hypothetical protein
MVQVAPAAVTVIGAPGGGRARQLIGAAGETRHLGRELGQGNQGCRRKLKGRLIVAARTTGLTWDRPDGTTRTCRNV